MTHIYRPQVSLGRFRSFAFINTTFGVLTLQGNLPHDRFTDNFLPFPSHCRRLSKLIYASTVGLGVLTHFVVDRNLKRVC